MRINMETLKSKLLEIKKFKLQDLRLKERIKAFKLSDLKKVKRKTWIIIGIIVLVLIAAKVFIFKSSANNTGDVQIITAVVKKGDVQKTIVETGTAKFSQSMPLSFEVGGTIQEIFVKTGDVVKEGQSLVRLDTASLEQSLKEAQDNHTSAQASYYQTLGDLGRKLKSNLLTAEKNLQTAKEKDDPDYLQNQYYLAQLNLKAASQKLAAAQGSGESDTYQLQIALSQAQLSIIDAKNSMNGGAAKDLEIVQDQYDAAKKALSDYESGAGSDYLSAKAQLTKSETELLTAQQNLDNAILKAPKDGTIVSSNVDLYQNVSSQTTVMTLVSNSQKFTVTASVDQTEITELKSGQKVELTLDTVADQVIEGTVESVSLAGTNTQNVVTYALTINVDQPTTLLRDQMSVNVSIITNEAKDVLTIPSEAVITQRGVTGVLVPSEQTTSSNSQNKLPVSQPQSSGQSNGQIPPESGNFRNSNSTNSGGNYKFVQIETGIDDGTNVEVKSGLTEGQVVIIQNSIKTTSSSSSSGNSSSQRQNSGLGGLAGSGGPPGGP